MTNCCGRARAYWITVALVFMACAVGHDATAEQRPPAARTGAVLSEFVGVWVSADADDTNCRREDWKEPGHNTNDALINVTPSALEGWESGCNILSARPRNRERKTVEVKLSCSGEGYTWRTSEIWHVQRLGDRKVFVHTQISTTDWRDESGKMSPAPRSDPTTLYLECK